MENSKPSKKILIIGAAGGLARITTRLIHQHFPEHEVVGVDSRDVSRLEVLPRVRYLRLKFTRGNFENLFRDHQFDMVYHLARISHSSGSQETLAKRLDLSVMGTSRILDLALKFQVKKMVILSTHHVYGAFADNSVFLHEDAPLRASIKFPELRDVVEMDQICTNWVWKHAKNMETIVLRPCNIIGSQINNSMTKYLTNTYSPYPIDYNPIFQFIHEFDMANVLLHCIDKIPMGIFNVATDEYISIRDAFKLLGTKGIPFPMTIGNFIAKHMSFGNIPEYLVDYLKFSCLIDNKALKEHLGENFFRFKIADTLKLIKLS